MGRRRRRRRKEKKKGEEKVVVRRGSGRQKGPIRRETQSQSDIICHSYTDSHWATDDKWMTIMIELERGNSK